MKRYNHYLFDLDGTLINTIDLIVECFHHSLDYIAQLKLPEEQIRSHVGLPLLEQFKVYLGHLPNIDYQDVMREHLDYQLKHWNEKIFVYEGITKLLATLKKDGAKLAIVTSRRMQTAELYTKELGLYDYFEFLATPECTQDHKPSPEPALYTLKRLNANPVNSLFIGDSIFDIECGHHAGIDTAFAHWGAFKPIDFKHKPTYVLQSPLELL